MKRSNDNQKCCGNCHYFCNDPQYLEKEFKGLTALSSAYGSVRDLDGICHLHDLYLAVNRCCEQFEAGGNSPQ